MKRKPEKKSTDDFVVRVGRALRRAGRVARKTARMHGTPIYIWREGKIVAEKPRAELKLVGAVRFERTTF